MWQTREVLLKGKAQYRKILIDAKWYLTEKSNSVPLIGHLFPPNSMKKLFNLLTARLQPGSSFQIYTFLKMFPFKFLLVMIYDIFNKSKSKLNKKTKLLSSTFGIVAQLLHQLLKIPTLFLPLTHIQCNSVSSCNTK